MKFDIPINYDVPSQKEIVVRANLPSCKVREIVQAFFDQKGLQAKTQMVEEKFR